MIKTTFILTAGQGLRYLAATVESIHRHACAPYELIMIDSMNGYGVDHFCRYHKMTFVSLPRTNSTALAWVTGMRIASGDVLFAMQDDVCLTRHAHVHLLNGLNSGPRIGGVSPGATQSAITWDGNVSNPRLWKLIERPAEGNVLLKREAIEQVGWFHAARPSAGLEHLYGELAAVGYVFMQADDTHLRQNKTIFANGGRSLSSDVE